MQAPLAVESPGMMNGFLAPNYLAPIKILGERAERRNKLRSNPIPPVDLLEQISC